MFVPFKGIPHTSNGWIDRSPTWIERSKVELRVAVSTPAAILEMETGCWTHRSMGKKPVVGPIETSTSFAANLIQIGLFHNIMYLSCAFNSLKRQS